MDTIQHHYRNEFRHHKGIEPDFSIGHPEKDVH